MTPLRSCSTTQALIRKALRGEWVGAAEIHRPSGRGHELRGEAGRDTAARRLLATGRLTLTGVGGVGKTRLAMRVANDVLRASLTACDEGGVMTLAKTGSRVIVVGGERFRWVVTGLREPAPGFVVELADAPASCLVATVTPYAVVTPGLVAQGIRLGREAGWEPYRTGADFQLAEPVWGEPIRSP